MEFAKTWMTNILHTDLRVWGASALISTFYGMSIIVLNHYLNKIDYVKEFKNNNFIKKNVSEKEESKNEIEKEKNIEKRNVKKKDDDPDDKLHLPLKETEINTFSDTNSDLKNKNDFNNLMDDEKIRMKSYHLKKITVANFMSSAVLFSSHSIGFTYGLINLFYATYFDFKYNNLTFLNHEDFMDKFIVLFVIQGYVWDIVAGFDFYPEIMKTRIVKNLCYLLGSIIAIHKQNLKYLSLIWITELPEIFKFACVLNGIRIEKQRDIIIYGVYYFFMKIIFPSLLLFYIYSNNLNLAIELQFMAALKIWYEVCLFSFWSVDKIFVNKDKKMEYGKNE